jgi:hypothetical protein
LRIAGKILSSSSIFLTSPPLGPPFHISAVRIAIHDDHLVGTLWTAVAEYGDKVTRKADCDHGVIGYKKRQYFFIPIFPRRRTFHSARFFTGRTMIRIQNAMPMYGVLGDDEGMLFAEETEGDDS